MKYNTHTSTMTMPSNEKNPSDKSVKAVTNLASRLYEQRRGCDMLDVIEEAMDMLGYDGDACLDDIADTIKEQLETKKQLKNDASHMEQEQLKEAERIMNIMARGAGVCQTTFVEDNWNPSPPSVNMEWLKTLDVIDALHAKLENFA
jgi:hypothetical protein